MGSHLRWKNLARRLGAAACCAAALVTASCSAFNPAFLNLVAPGAGEAFITLPNSPGYVVLSLVNKAAVDEQLVSFLRPDATVEEIRPRMRMRVRVTYSDGTFQTLELIDGSKTFVEAGFDAQSAPDLNQNDLTNVVARCDVASIALEPGSTIEVFIPATLVGYQLVQVNVGTGGAVDNEFQVRERTPPQFRALQVDDVDADGNIILRRNIGVRDVLSPTNNIVCGSVVAIIVDGSLALPFDIPEETNPSLDIDDEEAVAGIGGRFEFRVSVQ